MGAIEEQHVDLPTRTQRAPQTNKKRACGPSRGCLRRNSAQKRQPQIVANTRNSLSPPHESGPGFL
eukprot:1049356-Lingulodinium_polyedra.AAC.1